MSVPEPGGGSLWLPERGEVCGCLWLLMSMAFPAFGCFWLSVAVTVCGDTVAVAACNCRYMWLSATGYAYLWLSVVSCGYLSLSVAGSNYQWLSVACIC